MGFPKAIAQAQRQTVHEGVRNALDAAETLHRGLGKVESAHLIDLTAFEFTKLTALAKTLYETAEAMQKITDPNAGS